MPNANTLVVLRHGIFSKAAAMIPVESHIKNSILPGCRTDNVDYRWQDPILHSGIALAEHILQTMRANAAIDKIILVGHSQGGLVCRVAAAALCDDAGMRRSVRARQALEPAYFTPAITDLQAMGLHYLDELGRVKKTLHSVVMLGTPNAGAFTNGQLAMQATIALRAAKSVAAVRGWKNFDELTTDKLFTVLQTVRVPRVQYVSISGSSSNRYAASWPTLPVISRLGVVLDLPNDNVVEDSSVDLHQAPLPPEIEALDVQYTHVRSYTAHRRAIRSERARCAEADQQLAVGKGELK